LTNPTPQPITQIQQNTSQNNFSQPQNNLPKKLPQKNKQQVSHYGKKNIKSKTKTAIILLLILLILLIGGLVTLFFFKDSIINFFNQSL